MAECWLDDWNNVSDKAIIKIIDMIKKLFFVCLTIVSLSGCMSVNDCECKVDGSDTSIPHYDYEGSCSELNEEEENVTCVAK
ncbi:MAG: hypothetical protein IJJ77_05095 [Paludibacteraceae bacterium]|nr:hypothetical protein [Paludibacteraceae bacterium]